MKRTLPAFSSGPQWWAAPLAFVLCSPLGWPLLPVLLFLIVILAGIAVTLLPTLLGFAGAFALSRAPLALLPKRLLMPLLLILGVGLNALAWHAVFAAIHNGAFSPSSS